MFTVDITEDDEGRSAAKAVAALRRFPKVTAARLRRVVEVEKATHRYRNRTGAAELSTVAVYDGSLYTQQGDVDMVIEMAVEYASYLNDSGWSEFDKNVRKALDKIHSDVEKLK
jgi:hypothetical protein